MGSFLTGNQRITLQEAHHSCRLRKSADRIKAILLLDAGFSYQQIARILLLDEMTVRRYEKEYQESGIDGLLEFHYQGSRGLLTKKEEEKLPTYLRGNIYQTVKSVVVYVHDACHPHHNSRPFYGWIYKGEEKRDHTE